MTANPAEPTAASPAAFPVARLDLVEEIRRMRASPMPGGHLGKTVVHDADLRVVLMTLQAGAKIPRHQAKGSLTIQALAGRVIITLLDASFDLAAGQLLAIEHGVAHAVVAIEDSALLLTVAP